MSLLRGETGWFSIPADRPFLDDLAAGLIAALPGALEDAIVLLPNRRGARALSQALVRASGGKALLLPQIRALGDLDEGEPPFEPGDLALDLPPAISPWRRRFELARIAHDFAPALGRDLDAAAALELGDALGGFFDSLEIEEVADRARIETLAPADLAEHWRISADFLALAVEAWPARLEELGLADVTARRVAMLGKLADKWASHPPAGPVIAAGSTGSAPATARLLTVIAGLPRGCVVLPGLDEALADRAWGAIDDQHPQSALKRLLEGAGIGRGQVAPWPASAGAAGRWRRRVVNEALRPADATDDWRGLIETLRAEAGGRDIDPVAEGLEGLSLITARHEEEAAGACAVLLREALETPERTAALITPDQALARRVASRLARWGLAVDTTAGSPLADSSVGVLTGLAASAAADPWDPVRLLGILKHPLARLCPPGSASEALERVALRGARPRGWDEILNRLSVEAASPDLALQIRAALEPLNAIFANGQAAVADAARALAETLEALARGEDGGAGDLWRGSAGEAAAGLIAALIEDGAALPPVTAAQFGRLVETLFAGETIRGAGATHPRIQILGALEARLIRADVLVLAGLEEGVWPAAAPTDPFLSRPMRKALGLPSPERRIGLSAHDFAQAACAETVVLVHAERRGGQPSVKSRWLWRLETLASGADLAVPERSEVIAWTRALDAPRTWRPAGRPAPSPPLSDRPRRLAVTRIESLTRDPYAVWARDILRFYPMPRPDEAVDVRARGTAIHEAFEQFARRWPDALPPDAAGQFRTLYLEALVAAGVPSQALAREEALASETASWVAEWEADRRPGLSRIEVEKKGQATFEAPGGPFTVTAKTDRLEVTKAGLGNVLDYKTGAPPSTKQVETGFSPQLTLTAAILARGGFADLGALTPGDLLYVSVTGRKPAGKVENPVEDTGAAAAAEAAWEGLQRLIAHYDDESARYVSRTAPQFVKTYPGDYDHLARVFEWSTSGEEGE